MAELLNWRDARLNRKSERSSQAICPLVLTGCWVCRIVLVVLTALPRFSLITNIKKIMLSFFSQKRAEPVVCLGRKSFSLAGEILLSWQQAPQTLWLIISCSAEGEGHVAFERLKLCMKARRFLTSKTSKGEHVPVIITPLYSRTLKQYTTIALSLSPLYVHYFHALANKKPQKVNVLNAEIWPIVKY